MKHILILGGGYAGMIAAMRLNGRLSKHDDVNITLVNGAEVFVERIRLHQRASGQTLKRIVLPELLKGTKVKFVQAWVESIDADARTVKIVRDGAVQHLPFDHLLYALGSHVDRDSVEGVRDYAYTLDAQSAEDLRDALPAIAARGGELIVCGGGATGIEAATEFAEAFPALRVRLITSGRVGATLSEKGRAYLLKTFTRLGIQLDEHSTISQIDAGQVVLEDGRALAFDACLWAGSFSVPQIAAKAGLEVTATGRVLIDPYLRSFSHPEIYAVGDSAEFLSDPGTPIRMACATAMPMGVQGAENIAAVVKDKEQTAFSFTYAGQCYSLGRRAGLIQFLHSNDAARSAVITRLPGAWIKEALCSFTIWAIKFEKRFTGSYMWPGQNRGKQSAVVSKEIKAHEQPYGSL